MASSENRMDSYLYQDVTLTTTSNIRYEGRLVSYDQNNCTISLKNVRNFGTEHREADQIVAPEQKLFDFIVFDGRRIKAFDFVQRSNVKDPAILAVQGGLKGTRHAPVFDMLNHTGNGRNIRTIDPRGLIGSNGRQRNSSRPRDQSRDRRQRNDRPIQFKGEPRHVSFSIGNGRSAKTDRNRLSHIPHVPRSNLGRSKSNRDGKKKESTQGTRRTSTLLKPGEFAKPEKTEKFADDFDFDKAMERFNEMKISADETKTDDLEKQSETPALTSAEKEVYDHEKCFFDNLSSVVVGEKVRRTRKEEKSANKETFGIINLRLKRRFNGGQRSSPKFREQRNRAVPAL